MLPAAVMVTDRNRLQISADRQTRLWWDTTSPQRLCQADFVDISIPVLGCTSLAVFKGSFNRPSHLSPRERFTPTGDPHVR